MLFPLSTETRHIQSLEGIWRFRFDPTPGREGAGFEGGFFQSPLEDTVSMAVPSSWNDLFEDQRDRDFVGWVWYEKEFTLGPADPNRVRVLRFGSATHHAKVYINGRFVTEHVGGFTPFEAEVDEFLVPGTNRLTIALCNILDYTTLPIGIYTVQEIPGSPAKPVNSPNFDFYNYSGLHRTVQILTLPKTRVTDITVLSDVSGKVDYSVEVTGAPKEVRVLVQSEAGKTVTEGKGTTGSLQIPNVRLWNPRKAYLYTLKVEVLGQEGVIDTYSEPFGVRKIEVKKGQFLINDKPFYFKGFGKHEDAAIRGRGLDQVMNLKDLRLIGWMGGNSMRTSHYVYSEEFLRLCDQEGIVVIDEVPAVGLMANFNMDIGSLMMGSGEKPKTWELMKSHDAHKRVIREMITRDKNHPSVVMWSVGNEPESWTPGAAEYFGPMFDLARELDPAKRPVTCVLMQTKDVTQDCVAPLSDVICINRYYGWYFLGGGDWDTAKGMLRKELKTWVGMYPDKPILFTEYGADTVTGLHDTGSVMFTEEYQLQYYQANHEVFDEFANVVGEQAWNFADFATSQNVLRVQGNKKGLFTRQRQPKQAVFAIKERWESIPDFGYDKSK